MKIPKILNSKTGMLLALCAIGVNANAQNQLPLTSGELSAFKSAQSSMDPVLAAMAAATPEQRQAMSKLVGNAFIGDTVAVDMTAADMSTMDAEMSTMGVSEMAHAGNSMSARLPLSAVQQMQGHAGLYARPAWAALNTGVVKSQGDDAMRTDVVRRVARTVDGKGIRIGTLSDSFNCNPAAFVPGAPTSTADEDFINGDLPVDFIVLDNGPCPGTDEGRAMAQLIYDVAPASAGAFHTAFNGQADFAQGILELATVAGADVIVDDVIYFAEPMFQDGIIAQAATAVTEMGVPYFSSAGNNARNSYEDDFRGVNLGGIFAHDFDPGPTTDIFQSLVVVADATGFAQVTPSFQWDEPFLSVSGAPGSASDLDMIFFFEGALVLDCFLDMDPVAFPETGGFPPVCQFGSTINTGGDPVEIVSIVTFIGDVTVEAALVNFEGPNPTRVKYVPFRSPLIIAEYDTQSGTTYGHSNAAGMMGIGAAPFSTTAAFNDRDFGGACLPACAEPFSSAGGVEIRIDTAGNRLAAPENRFKPDVTGPDGSNTSFFFSDSIIDDDDGDGLLSPGFDGENPADEFPNFFGTSASAPHVAALAALMLDASELGPMDVNDGSKQRVCFLNKVTLLLEPEVADLLLNKKGRPIARKGFCLTPGEIELALEATALDMTRRVVDRLSGTFVDIPNSEGFDFDTGAGFVDGVRAIRAVAALPTKLILGLVR